MKTFHLMLFLGWVLSLAGCGENSASLNESPPVVNFYNWFGDINPESLPQFTQETGIRVVHDVYDSNEVLESKLLVGHSEYDLVVPTSNYVAKLGAAGLLLELDRSKLHNYAEIDPYLLAKLAKVDAGNRWGVPYSWGTTGLGFDVDQIVARMRDAPLDSWALLFDPQIVRKFQDCGVALLDGPADVIPAALNYLGRNPSSQSIAELHDAVALIARIQPFVRYFHSSQIFEDLANGELCLILGWSGSIYQSKRASAGLNLEYVIPKEGGELWFEVMAIPADAPHADNAYRLIDFLLTPRVAASFTNAMFYPSGVTAALELLDPAIRDEPSVYPTPLVMQRLYSVGEVAPDYERQRMRLWTDMKAGQLSH